MRRLLIITFSAVALAFAVPVAAAEFDVFGSYMTTDDFDDSWGLGVRTGWQFGDGPVGMELRASYFPELGTDLGDLVDEIDREFFDQQEIEAIPLDIGVTWAMSDTIHIGGGASYVILNSDFADLDDEAGFYGVLGFRTAGDSGIGFFAEGIYRSIRAGLDPDDIDDIDDIPDSFNERADLDLDGLTVNAGVTFRW